MPVRSPPSEWCALGGTRDHSGMDQSESAATGSPAENLYAIAACKTQGWL